MLRLVAEVLGRCASRFDKVRAALEASLDADDVGASAAVYVDGEPVVDIWGGYLDTTRTTAWESYVMNQVLWDDGYQRALGIVLAAYDAISS
jgi:hypothetical protein